MTRLYFKCTIIKGYYECETNEKPTTYVSAMLNNLTVLHSEIIRECLKPRWNETFDICANMIDDITFILNSQMNDGSFVELGRCELKIAEIDHLLKRFNFWFMHKIEMYMSSEIANSSKYTVFVGLSRLHRNRLSVHHHNLVPSSIRQIGNIRTVISDERQVFDSTLNLMQNLPYVMICENGKELPYRWEKRVTCDGREFYVDINNNTTQWEMPRPLPEGWEVRKLVDINRIYYYNRIDDSLCWQRPTAESILEYRANINAWHRRRTMNLGQYLKRYITSNKNIKFDLSPAGKVEAEHNIVKIVDRILGPIPENWELRIDAASKNIYFANNQTKKTSWLDPRFEWLNSSINPLPKEYILKASDKGIPYFVDQERKCTSLEDPRTGMSIIPPEVVEICIKIHFRDKMLKFRQLCKSRTMKGRQKISISRSRLWVDSFAGVMNFSAIQLHKNLCIKFENEEGLDYGGLAREWLYEISHELVNPNNYIFITRGSSNDYIFEINPNSSLVPNYEKLFIFVGRVIGIALFHSKYLDCSFSNGLYKQILNQPLILEDIQQFDLEFYNSLKWLSKNSIDGVMELYFCVEVENLGELNLIQLKPDGVSVQVTDVNKEEYIRLMIDWKMTYDQKDQIKHILHGINEIVPLTWLRPFCAKELEMLLNGIHEYNVNDWKCYTRYKGGYTIKSDQIMWFWKFVELANNERRGKILHFVCGTIKVPPTGFRDLMGTNGVQRFCIERWGSSNNLPRAHTCFNRLDLPPYKSYFELKTKLCIAIEETSGFFQE